MPLALANVPQILKFSGLDDAQIGQVMDYAKKNSFFAGQAATALGLKTESEMNVALLAQTSAKMKAAEQDIATISRGGAGAVRE